MSWKRIALGLVALVLAGVLVGCPTPPSTESKWDAGTWDASTWR